MREKVVREMCNVATENTRGHYCCTREAGHKGSCAAVPVYREGAPISPELRKNKAAKAVGTFLGAMLFVVLIVGIGAAIALMVAATKWLWTH